MTDIKDTNNINDMLDKLTIISLKRVELSINELKYFIPEIQRQQCDEHVNKIYNMQRTFYDKNGFYLINNSISIVIIGEKEYLIDGMHRVAAYHKLREENGCDKPILIHVDYYTCKSDADVDILYKYVNTSMPNLVSHMSINNAKILEYIINFFNKTFKHYIKTSNRPHKPYISLSKIIDYIKENNIIERANIKSGSEFTDRINELNNFYHTLPDMQFRLWECEKALETHEKIRKMPNNLYFGLYSANEWLERIVESYQYNIPYNKIHHFSATHKIHITPELKKKVWNSSLCIGTCYCCDKEIAITEFECGHIIPRSAGGPTSLENLRPICRKCNSDMGTRNLEYYKQLIIQQRI